MTTKRARTYTATCRWNCGRTWETPFKPPVDGLGCGQGACLAQHNAAVVAVRQQAAAVRRDQGAAPRIVLMGEFAQAMLLAGGSRKADRLAAERRGETRA